MKRRFISTEILNFMDDKDLTIYEVGYLLVPELSEGDVSVETGNLKDVIASLGGLMVSDGYPKQIELAYPMRKSVANVWHTYTKGYFGWLKFEMTSDQTAALKEKLDQNKKVIRFLLIKTSREDTMSQKRVSTRPTKSKVPAEGEVVAEVSEVELDSALKDLVKE